MRDAAQTTFFAVTLPYVSVKTPQITSFRDAVDFVW
jgi:hypothetical protein